MMKLSPLITLLSSAAALNWQRNGVPISGQLVLTDVHAVWDNSTSTVVAYATGEGGVLLKLSNSPAGIQAANWSVTLDTSFPFYWYGVYSWDANTTIISG